MLTTFFLTTGASVPAGLVDEVPADLLALVLVTLAGEADSSTAVVASSGGVVDSSVAVALVNGLAPVLARYARMDALAGRTVRVHAADGGFDATACGLGEDGALRVRLADGTPRHVHAGEVSVRAA